MSIVEIVPNQSLNGNIVVPGDKSISHRAILMSCLVDEGCKISNLNRGRDVLNTLGLAKALGVKVNQTNTNSLYTDFDRKYPKDFIEARCGNSGTMARLGMGVVSGLGITVEFDGDESLRSRPMDRVVSPLSQMGAQFIKRDNNKLPIKVVPAKLKGIEIEGTRPSAQVKSAILFAGLNAEGKTTYSEAKATRKHTEELFALAKVPFVIGHSDSKYSVTIEGPIVPSGFELNVPCDPSQAAFFVAGAILCNNSHITIENVYLGKERAGFLEVLKRMNANILIESDKNEILPTGTLTASSSELIATDIAADEVADLIDEIPILAVCAAKAEGVSQFHGLSELRVKETDRLATISEMLRDFGTKVSVFEDNLIIHGGRTGTENPVEIDSHFDHRIAMSAAILALSLKDSVDPIKIHDFECVETSYVGFQDDLSALGVLND